MFCFPNTLLLQGSKMNVNVRKYKHLFFDLDHTLWDFDANANHTLLLLFDKYGMAKYFDGFDAFFESYQPINLGLWAEYRDGKINKEFLNVERFYRPLCAAGFDDLAVAKAFADDFIKLNPQQTRLMPFALEVLNYLAPRYQMHIVTNGFTETQFAKLNNCGIRHFFKQVFVSEQIGASKPKKAFFDHAVKYVNARKKESIVIGDNLEADVLGAKNAGIDAVYFNPAKQQHATDPTFEISSLQELIGIL
jgi:putative hydrolase of the HAD superfamily